MLIFLSDPADPSVKGALSSPDAIPPGATSFNLLLSDAASSDALGTLFDLSPPPSFSGPFMVFAALDDAGALQLFLAAETGDTSFPFATLADFPGATGSGQGNLLRNNRLPPAVNWSVTD